MQVRVLWPRWAESQTGTVLPEGCTGLLGCSLFDASNSKGTMWSVLGLVLFNIIFSDLEVATEGTSVGFAEVTILRGAGDRQEGGWRIMQAWMLLGIDGDKAVLLHKSRGCDTKSTALPQPPPAVFFTVQLYLLVVFCLISPRKWSTEHWPMPWARKHHSTELCLLQLSVY